METATLSFMNTIMIWGTLVLQLYGITLLLGLFGVKPCARVVAGTRANGITLSFIIVLSAALGSLYYSSIAGFVPCTLCWYQRILLFPQVLLLGTAYIRKTREILLYTVVLSSVGALVSLYQVIIERIPAVAAFCAPGEVAVSCGTIYVEGFSYITIPVMGLTTFVVLILIALVGLRTPKIAVLDEQK